MLTMIDNGQQQQRYTHNQPSLLLEKCVWVNFCVFGFGCACEFVMRVWECGQVNLTVLIHKLLRYCLPTTSIYIKLYANIMQIASVWTVMCVLCAHDDTKHLFSCGSSFVRRTCGIRYMWYYTIRYTSKTNFIQTQWKSISYVIHIIVRSDENLTVCCLQYSQICGICLAQQQHTIAIELSTLTWMTSIIKQANQVLGMFGTHKRSTLRTSCSLILHFKSLEEVQRPSRRWRWQRNGKVSENFMYTQKKTCTQSWCIASWCICTGKCHMHNENRVRSV